jgi:AraC-like DNA-binding protein
MGTPGGAVNRELHQLRQSGWLRPPLMADVNQQLIADRLNISRATVSRCFTNHPGINPTTRAQVFALAAQLGYTHLEKRADRRAPAGK